MAEQDVRLAGRMPGVRCAIAAAVTRKWVPRAALRYEVDRHPRPASVSAEDAPAADVQGRKRQTDVGLGPPTRARHRAIERTTKRARTSLLPIACRSGPDDVPVSHPA